VRRRYETRRTAIVRASRGEHARNGATGHCPSSAKSGGSDVINRASYVQGRSCEMHRDMDRVGSSSEGLQAVAAASPTHRVVSNGATPHHVSAVHPTWNRSRRSAFSRCVEPLVSLALAQASTRGKLVAQTQTIHQPLTSQNRTMSPSHSSPRLEYDSLHTQPP
jgi:hypothetical protein